MSNTIRRKNGYDINKVRTSWETNENWVWVRVFKDPVTLARDLAKYHGDAGYYQRGISKWFRSQEHDKMKNLSKGELARFWKDPEYEVQIERRLLHDYWD